MSFLQTHGTGAGEATETDIWTALNLLTLVVDGICILLQGRSNIIQGRGLLRSEKRTSYLSLLSIFLCVPTRHIVRVYAVLY